MVLNFHDAMSRGQKDSRDTLGKFGELDLRHGSALGENIDDEIAGHFAVHTAFGSEECWGS